jgi:hypothetical protein
VIRALDVAEPPLAAAEAERDAPVGALPVRAPRPPLASGVVSGVEGEVVEVVVVSHVGTGGVVATVVVVVAVDVVVELVSIGVVSTGVVSIGVVSGMVVVEVVVAGVVVDGVVVDGTVRFEQSLTSNPDDNALGLFELFACWGLLAEDGVEVDADADAEGVVLELV